MFPQCSHWQYLRRCSQPTLPGDKHLDTPSLSHCSPAVPALRLHGCPPAPQVAAEVGSYYYLSFIGTAPEARGKGYGSLLLRCITDQADQEGRWCLLEATSERSEVRGQPGTGHHLKGDGLNKRQLVKCIAVRHAWSRIN